VPTEVICYLILPLRYAGSMSYFICDGAGYHITCIPCVGFLCLHSCFAFMKQESYHDLR